MKHGVWLKLCFFCVRYVILNIATVGPWTAQGWTAASSWTASCLFFPRNIEEKKKSFLYGLAGGSLDGTNDTPSITRSLIAVAMAEKRRPQYGVRIITCTPPSLNDVLYGLLIATTCYDHHQAPIATDATSLFCLPNLAESSS